MNKQIHEQRMQRAIYYAQKAARAGEVPVGAVVVDENGKIIGRGLNRREEKQNVTEHAELMALQQAQRKIGSWRLENCDLYVTLEPCLMCTGAIIQSRIRHVYFGAYDPKAGAVCSVTQMLDVAQWNHHTLYTGGILEDECSAMLKDFFKLRRQQNKEKKRLDRLQRAGVTDCSPGKSGCSGNDSQKAEDSLNTETGKSIDDLPVLTGSQ